MPLHHPFQPDLQNKKEIFQGRKFKVSVGTNFELVEHPGAAIILPLLDESHLILIRNRRFAVGQTLMELPAGTLEQNEDPLTTASRELIEETGYEAGEISLLTKFFTSPGFCNELMFSYVAKNLVDVGQQLEETEEIEVVKTSWEKALSWIQDGTIQDAKTISTLLFYHTFHRR